MFTNLVILQFQLKVPFWVEKKTSYFLIKKKPKQTLDYLQMHCQEAEHMAVCLSP